mgnify:CR=1 FL=1
MQTDLFDQTEAQGPGERQTDLEDLIAETGQYQAGQYQVCLRANETEYEVVHATTGDIWTCHLGKRLTNLLDATACAKWHHEYDLALTVAQWKAEEQEEI